MRRAGKRVKAKDGGAKLPVAKSSRNTESSRVRDLEKRLTEPLEQQTATSEILRVIASSPTDLQPVFEAIAQSAVRLCEAVNGTVHRFDGSQIHPVALYGMTPQALAAHHRVFPLPPGRGTATGRAILTRAVVHVDIARDPDYEFTDFVQAGLRTVLSVPMLRDGQPIGAISVTREEGRPFSDSQIALLQTFAAQAVIAIENVRLFTETKEALEQQTATAEILRVISSSPTDVQPVFDVIVEHACRLCEGVFANVVWFDGELMHYMAQHGFTPEAQEAVARLFPARPTRASMSGRAILSGTVVYTEDARSDDDLSVSRALSELMGFRAQVSVPLQQVGTTVGAITVARRAPGRFPERQVDLLRAFADQAVIAIENVRLFKELEARNRELTEALERQTATADILRVISSSPTDLQPVLDTVSASAARLSNADDGSVFLAEGNVLRLVAHRLVVHHGSMRAAGVGEFTIPIALGTVGGRAVLTRQIVHVQDVQAADSDFPEGAAYARQLGQRAQLAVPLLREGVAIGVLQVRRATPVAYTEAQTALLQTFADQAVIAIENVRLFTELEARNRDLVATSEILQVISRSPTDAQPVFETIIRSAVVLCEAVRGNVYRFDGRLLHHAAQHGMTPEALEASRRDFPRPPSRGSVTGRAILTRTVVHIDIAKDPEYELGGVVQAGFRTLLAVPMLHDDEAIGAIVISRAEDRPFSDRQIALLQTFADQAVIAIENVRLFTELQEKNRAVTEAHGQVTEALEQQTATSDILRVISSSPTDLQPVFKAIMECAVRLCGARFSAVFLFDGERLHFAAHHNLTPDNVQVLEGLYPMRPSRDQGAGRAILTAATVQIEDALADPEYRREVAAAGGWRSLVAVPMLRDRQPIGAISVGRRAPDGGARPFSDREIELLKTFADQAVIAIENVRLFNELRERTAELTRSVGELRALGDVGRALSSTLDLETVLQTIVTRANQLAGTAGCVIWEYDAPHEAFRLRASHYADARDAAVLPAPGGVTTVPRGQGLTTRVMELRQPVQITDIAVAGAYESPVRQAMTNAGHRALLGLPLLREDDVIGVLAVTSKTPGEFAPEIVRLLSTFATQSALAIQNARLFQEIADKGRQLEAASRHKSEFLANMSHELRTPLNAILGFSEVLAERMFGEVNEKQAEYLQDILSSGRHLLSLINDILDLSKVEAGRLELELGQFHLPAALDNALTLVRERATRHGITLNQTVDDRVGHIVADERKVKQVLLNLLSNAVKFTPDGGTVALSTTVTNEIITVAVRDTGIGIAPEDQAAIFEEFRQVGGDDARKQEGTGLGLTLAKKFVELHGGRIWVESQMGQGSTFTFTLPVRPDGA
jgi:GAF domain-containing protein